MAIGQYTRSDEIGHDNTIIALGMYTWSDDFERGMPSSPLERYTIIDLSKQTRLDNVWHGISTWNLGSTHGWITLGVACYHRHWDAQAVE